LVQLIFNSVIGLLYVYCSSLEMVDVNIVSNIHCSLHLNCLDHILYNLSKRYYSKIWSKLQKGIKMKEHILITIHGAHILQLAFAPIYLTTSHYLRIEINNSLYTVRTIFNLIKCFLKWIKLCKIHTTSKTNNTLECNVSSWNET
jgi:hypothetical protein